MPKITATGLTANRTMTFPDANVRIPRSTLIYVYDYGARGDDTGDDGPAIQSAITAAQAQQNATVILGPGVFRVSTAITISGSNQGIAIVGNSAFASLKQGSVLANSEIHWVGGASAIFTVNNTYTRFVGFAMTQDGTATHAIKCTTGGNNYFADLTFQRGQAGTAAHFSTAAVEFTNGVAYGLMERCESGSSPTLVIGGAGSTTFTIRECVIDSQSNSKAFITLNHAMDILRVRDCTFNIESTDCIVFDSTGIGSNILSSLIWDGNEYDSNVGSPDARMLKLKNVRHARITDGVISGQGNANPLVELTTSRATIDGNDILSVSGGLSKTLDSSSYVRVGQNFLNPNNVASIASTTSQTTIIPVTVSGGAARIHAELTNAQGTAIFTITPANNGNFEVQAAYSGDGDPGFTTVGQPWWVVVRNTIGAPLGTITWNASEFHLQAAWVNPANGFSRAIQFYFNGSTFQELTRGTADVAN